VEFIRKFYLRCSAQEALSSIVLVAPQTRHRFAATILIQPQCAENNI